MSTHVLTAAPDTANGKRLPTAGTLERLEFNASLFIALGSMAAYCPPLMRSFWVDEAGTWWMACRGPIAAIERTSHWPGQSILFAVITSFFCFDGWPLRELMLRVPALLGAAAACYFLYRFAEDAIGVGAGRIAAVLLAFSPSTVDLATQARPYTLAMAAAAASCWTLYRWMESRKRSWLACYVISSALVVYLHYFFSVIFVVHAVFLVYEFAWRRRFFRRGELLAGYVVTALLVMPLLPHVLLLLHESHTLPFGSKPSGSALAELLTPSLVIAGVFASGLLVHFAWPNGNGGSARLAPGVSAMLLAWWSLGPLLLFTVSSTTAMQVFVDRYLAYSGLALVLLLTYAGYSIFGARKGFIWALPIILLTGGNVVRGIGHGRPGDHELGPFMRVIRDESANTGPNLPPVLFQSSLVESNFYDWQSGNSANSYLYAPFAAYPMKNRLVPLPFRVTPEVEGYLSRLLNTDLKDKAKVIFVTHDAFRITWFAKQFEDVGFNSRCLRLNDYWVMVFERRAGGEGH